MQLTFIHDEQGLHGLEPAWNDLLARAATNVPFLRHEYLQAWWSTLGGGEWQEGALWIGVGRGETGELLGLAPLFHTRTRDGASGLMLIGSIEISDYLDLVAPTETMPAFAEGLLQALETGGPAGWEVLDLYNLPEASPSLPSLEAAAERRGWRVAREKLQPCPVATLPSDWEAYLMGLEKKQRHELRRKLRRAESGAWRVTWRFVERGEDLTAATETFMSLMALDGHKARFLTPAMRAQFEALLRAAQSKGWLQLAFLEVGGKPAATYLNFDYNDRVFVYNSGLDPEYQWLSPGWVLVAYLIRWAVEQGRKEFDFLRGDEDYKFRLGGIPRSIYRLTIRR
jgi:CelD/BcsL family acetyltransferase involved in cellulose biosynthesis